MADPSWTDIAQAIGSVCSVAVAILGFLILTRQVKLLTNSIRCDTSAKLHEVGFSIIKMIAKHPETRPYIFEGKPIKESDPDYGTLLPILEIGADYLQHIILSEPCVQKDAWKNWDEYVSKMLNSCPAICAYIKQRESWFTEGLIKRLP